MEYTPNFELKKPQPNEAAKIADLNENTDILDAALAAIDTLLTAVQQTLGSHTADRLNPHGTTAEQLGVYTKLQSLGAETRALFGLPATAVPDDALATIAQFGLKKQVYDTAGTYTFVAPYTGDYVVEVLGAGGGGSTSGRQGGGGGYAQKTVSLTKGQAISVVVGNNAAHTTGGTSSFGVFISATGGGVGGSQTTNGRGGEGVGGDINISGTGGGSGYWGQSFLSVGDNNSTKTGYGYGASGYDNAPGSGVVIITMRGAI